MCHSLNCRDGKSWDNLCFPIEMTNDYKYLGLVIDHKLNWKIHSEKTKKSLIIATRKFYLLWDYVSTEILKLLYYAIVDSRLNYGLTWWGGCSAETLKPVKTLQKHILRVIFFKSRQTHSFPLFKCIKALPIRNLFVFKVLKFFLVVVVTLIQGDVPHIVYDKIIGIYVTYRNRQQKDFVGVFIMLHLFCLIKYQIIFGKSLILTNSYLC